MRKPGESEPLGSRGRSGRAPSAEFQRLDKAQKAQWLKQEEVPSPCLPQIASSVPSVASGGIDPGVGEGRRVPS